jgi:hypothetical protein
MNKRFIKTIAIVLVMTLVLFQFTGCYGKFQLTRNLYKWNGQLGDKFINTIVMWVLMIVPVYSIVGFVDFVILNVIEFWTGTNPIAMQPGDKETQLVEMDGKMYQITATQNRFDINQVNTNVKISLVFSQEEQAWYVEQADGQSIKIAEFSGNSQDILSLIQPDGQIMKVNLNNNNLILN